MHLFLFFQATPTDGHLLSELCDSFLPACITSCQLLVYTTTTECDHRHGYTAARRHNYAKSLCQQVYSDLVALINSLNILETREDSQLCDARSREQTEQEELCEILCRFYDVILPEEEKVSVKVSTCFSKFQKTVIKIGHHFMWSQALDLSFEPSLPGVCTRAHIGIRNVISQAVKQALSYVETLS